MKIDEFGFILQSFQSVIQGYIYMQYLKFLWNTTQ